MKNQKGIAIKIIYTGIAIIALGVLFCVVDSFSSNTSDNNEYVEPQEEKPDEKEPDNGIKLKSFNYRSDSIKFLDKELLVIEKVLDSTSYLFVDNEILFNTSLYDKYEYFIFHNYIFFIASNTENLDSAIYILNSDGIIYKSYFPDFNGLYNLVVRKPLVDSKYKDLFVVDGDDLYITYSIKYKDGFILDNDYNVGELDSSNYKSYGLSESSVLQYTLKLTYENDYLIFNDEKIDVITLGDYLKK